MAHQKKTEKMKKWKIEMEMQTIFEMTNEKVGRWKRKKDLTCQISNENDEKKMKIIKKK
jgi:hypothetical protein